LNSAGSTAGPADGAGVLGGFAAAGETATKRTERTVRRRESKRDLQRKSVFMGLGGLRDKVRPISTTADPHSPNPPLSEDGKTHLPPSPVRGEERGRKRRAGEVRAAYR
jgi:hypothetical protein